MPTKKKPKQVHATSSTDLASRLAAFKEETKDIPVSIETSVVSHEKPELPPKKADVGRPTIMTPLTIQKLNEAFALGATDREATAYADIAMQTLYNYQNEHPEFLEQKNRLKLRPLLRARQTINKSLDDPAYAWRYGTKHLPDEFGQAPAGPGIAIQVNVNEDRDTYQPKDIPNENA